MILLRTLPSALLAGLYFSTTTIAHSPHIFARQASSCLAGFARCPQAGLPSNFCCPAKTTCLALAGNTTALCCGDGEDCRNIKPISCDLSNQDAGIKPNATLKTTALDVPLQQCGTECCPHGYSCNTVKRADGKDQCVQNPNQDVPPTSNTQSALPTTTRSLNLSSPTISTTATITSTGFTSSPFSTPTTAVTSIPQNEGPCPSCPAFPLNSILICSAAGFLAGILFMGLCLCIYSRVRQRKDWKRASEATTASFGNPPHIGTPHLQNGYDGRVDFLVKPPGTASTARTMVDDAVNVASMARQATVKKTKSIFSGRTSHKENGSDRRTLHDPMPSPLRVSKRQKSADPVTPPQQMSQQFEYGDIPIGTDSGDARSISVERPRQQNSGFTPSPKAQNYKKDTDNPKRIDTSGFGINRGSGLGVGGSAIPDILIAGNGRNTPKPARNERSQSRGRGPGSHKKEEKGFGEGLLQPAPHFAQKNRSTGQFSIVAPSVMTDISYMLEKAKDETGEVGAATRREHRRTGSSGPAGLPPKGMPFVYKSPQGY